MHVHHTITSWHTNYMWLELCHFYVWGYNFLDTGTKQSTCIINHTAVEVLIVKNFFFLRYKNAFCAECHGVTDILYWTMEIGCVTVTNDQCHYPRYYDYSGVQWSKEYFMHMESFANDPSIHYLKER